MYVLFPLVSNVHLIACWYANLASIVLDYITRQKVGGVNLNAFHLYQLAAPQNIK
jgi:hypothetical protein